MSVNRRRGIVHWIEHVNGSAVCVGGLWNSISLKPYPKVEAETEWRKLVTRWNAR